MPLSPGVRLGTYEILGPLGAGGMGEVYRARDTRLRREVAVKVLPADVASSPDRLLRFEREAQIVAGLNHPNIVTLFSIEEEGGIHFLTLELVEGRSLASLVTAGGLPVSRVLELSIPLADALAAAHERGVIHRDFKPGNVMVTREGRIKVLDFGLAKLVRAETLADAATLTAPPGSPISTEGQPMGTVPYMAPEQIRGETADARSDLFALGIMLYELITGRRPFNGVTAADVGASILRDTPEPLQSIEGDLPHDLDRIVARCLEKNPRECAQTAEGVRNELRRLEQDLKLGVLAPASTPAPVPGIPSIAVLPFVNRSRDDEDEYFSDGLADELLNVLTKIRGLKVAARSSAFTFKGRQVAASEVGRALNVAAVLEGSVRKAGNQVRISVQLVKVSDGYHLWSERYDRTLEDIFAVQDDIAQSVVKELRTTLRGEEPASKELRAEVARAVRGRGRNAEAHRLYLQGRYCINRFARDSTANGIRYLKEALKLDSGFALAWAELGQAYSRESDLGWVPMAEGYGRARKAVEQALSLEPDLAEGHAQMGWIQMAFDWNWSGAEVSYRRALELAPGNALVLSGVGTLADSLGRVEEAIGLYRQALEQDPLSSTSYSNLGAALRTADRLPEAEEVYRKALDLAPERVSTRANLSLVLLAQDQGEEALAEALREPHPALRLWALAIVYRAAGRTAESDEALGGLLRQFAEEFAYQISAVYAARGDADLAFEWLERAYEQRDGGLAELKASPRFRPLRGDPRWPPLMKKLGFEA